MGLKYGSDVADNDSGAADAVVVVVVVVVVVRLNAKAGFLTGLMTDQSVEQGVNKCLHNGTSQVRFPSY